MNLLVRAFLCLVLGGCAASLAHAENGAPSKSTSKSQKQSPAALPHSTNQGTALTQSNAVNGVDKNALNKLISSINNASHSTAPSTPPIELSTDVTDKNTSPPFSGMDVPPANELWQLSDKQCLAYLNDAQIKTHKPQFATPFVRTPLILDSPIEGVTIDTRWSTEPFRKVMDCRLIVSLIQLAAYARQSGVVQIQYYSTWRPIKTFDKCGQGNKGKKCKKLYQRAQKGHLPSQHSRATAIDIRWFTFEDGTVVDVLEHYEKNFHEPPCGDNPVTEKGQFLKNLACDLHAYKTFNVMLTPNADRDHANHFHFDITPNVNWYIIR